MQKHLVFLVLILAITSLTFGCSPEVKTEKLKIIEFRARSSNAGKIVFAKYKNNSGKPIKALKGKWYLFDDFHEISDSGNIRYSSSETTYIGESLGTLEGFLQDSHHVIQPGEIICLLDAEGSGEELHQAFPESSGMRMIERLSIPSLKNSGFSVDLTEVILAEEISAATSPHKPRKENTEIPSVSTPEPETHRANAVQSKADEEQAQAPQQTPQASPPSSTHFEPPTAEPTEARVLYWVIDVAPGDALNIRAGPGTRYPTIERLRNGFDGIQIVGATVINDATEWVKIAFGDEAGWANKQYLKPR